MLAILKRLFVGFILLSTAHMGYAQLVVDGAFTPEELVEDVVLLTVTIKEARANDVDTNHRVRFCERKGCLLNLL